LAAISTQFTKPVAALRVDEELAADALYCRRETS
jgi:hypothetical protein